METISHDQKPIPDPNGVNAFRQGLPRRVKFAARNALARAMVPLALAENRLASRVAILSYHRVLPEFPAGSSRSAVVSPEAFEAQLRFLAEGGYTTLTLEAFRRVVWGEIPAPPRPVLITFDDGYADNFIVAHRIGRRCDARLCFFLPTGIIGLDRWPYAWGERPPQETWHMAHHPELWRPLTWDEVRAMEEEGASFGCHGYLHRRLSTLSGDALEEEIGRAIAVFEQHLGRRPLHFSIPWGDEAAFTAEAVSLMRRQGIECIYTTFPRRLHLPAAGDVFPRISVREHDDLASFARKIQGAHDWLYRIFAPLGIRNL